MADEPANPKKMETSQKVAYHITDGPVVMYTIDANSAVAQHPKEWSFTPWPAPAPKGKGKPEGSGEASGTGETGGDANANDVGQTEATGTAATKPGKRNA